MKKIFQQKTHLILGLLIFIFSIAAPIALPSLAYADTASDKAKAYCKKYSGRAKDSCITGYTAGYKKKNNPCSNGRIDPTSCKDGFRKGESARPGGGGGGGTSSSGGSGGDSTCRKSFFGLVPWYKYIHKEFKYTESNLRRLNDKEDKCEIKCFNVFAKAKPNECGQKGSDIPYVLLAVIDNLLRIAGIVAVAFVIVGAIRLITSQGNPEDAASAQSTIINALIGLAVAIVAVAFISFVGGRLG